MKLAAFDYELPTELIAYHPAAERSASRLLHVKNNNEFQHLHFYDIVGLLHPNDLIVLNTTKVIKARLFGHKPTGGKLECLIERIQDDRVAWAHIGCSKSPKIGGSIIIHDTTIDVIDRKGELFCLQLPSTLNWDTFLDQNGLIPLPPYIDRALMPADESRYQTVFAKHNGAVAAPTAGLHFNEALLQQLKQNGIQTAEITLHVGAGTFQPVRSDNIEEHHMHSERIEVDQQCIDQINQTKANGGRVIAIGTTVVRALESAAITGTLQATKGETDIYIYPGKTIRVVDSLVTNFHLPKSSLLMLVSAFAGSDVIRDTYQEAINNQYRFFSYGDAMLLHKK